MAEAQRIKANGIEFRVLIEGPEGAPWITFLHSLATNLSLWDEQAAAFRDRFRILRYDARGHGQTQVPTGPYTMDDFVADAVALWDALGIQRSHVVGLSMGGMTGFGLALTHRDRVNSLVAADCRSDAPEFFQRMWDERERLVAQGGLPAIEDMTLKTWFTETTRSRRPELVERVRRMIATTPLEGYRGTAAALRGLNYKSRLSEIAVPALLIVGAHDGPHPAEMRAMAGLIRGAGFIEVPDAAHLSNIEQPELFNSAVTAFLAKLGRGGNASEQRSSK